MLQGRQKARKAAGQKLARSSTLSEGKARKEREAQEEQDAPEPFPSPLLSAASLYMANCASCHGSEMRGGHGSSLVDGRWEHADSDSALVKLISDGIPNTAMPAWKLALSQENIREIVGFAKYVTPRLGLFAGAAQVCPPTF